MTTDKIESEPCEECGVDTVALLDERDQLKARVAELEAMLEDDPLEHNTLKYLEEQLSTKGEHSLAETIDNVKWKLTHYKSALKEALWLLENSGEPSWRFGLAQSNEWLKRRTDAIARIKEVLK